MNPTKSFLAATIGFALWTSHAVAPAIGQQPQGGPVQGPQQVARGGDRVMPGPAAAAPSAPDWIPLSPAHQEYVDQILHYWEFKSNQTERYRCTFKRWEYETVFGPKDTFKTYSEGVIKYAAPDKGLFHVEKLMQYEPPREAGGKPKYVAATDNPGDYWICDGMWVYQFDYNQKALVQSQLPPEYRGKAIGKGPLPFLFNAKADDIRARFWIHAITPAGAKQEYWLEAVPKTQEDAANFKMIHVIIDETDYLPKAMVLFDTNFIPGVRPSRTTFQFNEREVNFSVLADQIMIWRREFYEPQLPKGWKKIVNKFGQPAAPPLDPAAGNRATRDENPTRR